MYALLTPPSGQGCQIMSSGLMIWPRWMPARAINTDLAGVGRAMGAASAVTASRCAASQERASIAVVPARTSASRKRRGVRRRMAGSADARREDGDDCGSGDRDAVGHGIG